MVLFNETDDASVGADTVTVHLAVLPLCVKTVMVVVPTALATISPSVFTVATEGLLELHAMVLSVVFAGLTVATNDVVSPTAIEWVVLSNEIEVATTGDTVTVQLAVLPLLVVAVMVAVPAEIAETEPLAFTVATEGLLELHVMVLSVVFDGLTVAAKEVVSPTNIAWVVLFKDTDVAAIGKTVTVIEVACCPCGVLIVTVATPGLLA